MKKIISLCLSLLMFISLPVQVLAAEGTTPTVAGFFDFYSSDQAKGIVNSVSNASWDNFVTSLDYMETANALRSKEGAGQLKVSDKMMAIAMVQAMEVLGKPGTLASSYSSTGNNTAWGQTIGAEFGSGKNPFDSWVTKEKENYLANPNTNSHNIEHYVRFKNSSWTVSGFYCHQDDSQSFPTVFVQTFSAKETAGEKAYTVAEYKNRVSTYEAYCRGEYPERVLPLYRLYNPNSGEHFYTLSANEAINLTNAGWKDEGTGWYTVDSGHGQPVYRLYNPNAGDHHYTTDANERNSLVKMGWKDENIGWYAPTSGSTNPVYREYNPNAKAGAHNFTTSLNEHQSLVKMGWKDEGTAWLSRIQ